MAGLFRLALYATASLAVGSWIGLGHPRYATLKPFLGRAWSHVPSVEQIPDVDEWQLPDVSRIPLPWDKKSGVDEGPEAGSDRTTEFAPLPQEVDPDLVPGARRWPELNPEVTTRRAWIVAEGPRRPADNGRRLVTLTFDDGPFPETTPAVLRLLARFKTHATFFVIGRYLDGDGDRAKASRDVLRRVVAAGHLVGNHTHDHVLLTSISHTQVLEQVDDGAASIERATGKYPFLFRPPFGRLDEFGQDAAKERHLELVLWSIEAQDMVRDDAHEMFRDLRAQLEYKEGGVVLLHDIRWSSYYALKELLGWIREHRYNPKHPERIGYDLVDLPTYLRATAADPLPYASREEFERAWGDEWNRVHHTTHARRRRHVRVEEAPDASPRSDRRR